MDDLCDELVWWCFESYVNVEFCVVFGYLECDDCLDFVCG